jgi:conjugal transfer/entry exclusion protein
MDKALEEKLNQINDNVLGIKQDLESVKNKLDGYIEFSSERFTKIEDTMAARTDLQNFKQEIFDKISDAKYEVTGKVNDHELRIEKLETNIA